MKILALRFSSIGDVALCQPLLFSLLESHPHCTIFFVTLKEYTEIVPLHPRIRVLGISKWRTRKEYTEIMKMVRGQGPFDFILDLQGSLRSWKMRLSFPLLPSLVIEKHRWKRWALIFLKVDLFRLLRLPNSQVQRHWQDWGQVLGLGTKPSELSRASTGPGGSSPTDKKILVLAPGASFNTKKWSIQNYFSLAQEWLKVEGEESQLIILAGKDDLECKIFDSIGDPRLLNLQGKTSLSQGQEILKKASLVVGNDSGLNHLAENAGIPVITIFGPTSPSFGFSPRGEGSVALSHSPWCHPCSAHGSRPCFRSSAVCLEKTTVGQVLAEIKKRWP